MTDILPIRCHIGFESLAIQWIRRRHYEDAVQRINARSYDLALVDIRLGDRDGFDVLRYSREKRPNQTVVLITGYGSAEVGVEALRAGAFDLLTKPLIDQELEVAIDRAMSRQAVEQENRQLKAQLDYRYGVDNIIGVDHRMKRIFEMIDSIADTRATVLITGESGTGKSLIARAIHRRSTRATGHSSKLPVVLCQKHCSKANCSVT